MPRDKAQTRTLYLPASGTAAQLADDLDRMEEASEMPLGEQSSMRVDGTSPAERNNPSIECWNWSSRNKS